MINRALFYLVFVFSIFTAFLLSIGFYTGDVLFAVSGLLMAVLTKLYWELGVFRFRFRECEADFNAAFEFYDTEGLDERQVEVFHTLVVLLKDLDRCKLPLIRQELRRSITSALRDNPAVAKKILEQVEIPEYLRF